MTRDQNSPLPLMTFVILGGLAFITAYHNSRGQSRASIGRRNYSAATQNRLKIGPARTRREIEGAVFQYLAKDGTKVSLDDDLSDYFNGGPFPAALGPAIGRADFFKNNGLSLHPDETRWLKSVRELVIVVISWYQRNGLLLTE